MKIEIYPEEIVKFCLWDNYVYYVIGSEKEAEKILKEQYFKGEIFENLDEYEYLHDTQEDMDILEVLDQNDNLIKFNN